MASDVSNPGLEAEPTGHRCCKASRRRSTPQLGLHRAQGQHRQIVLMQVLVRAVQRRAACPVLSSISTRAHCHDGQRVRQVRGVLQQPPALVQRLEDQLQLP